MRVVTMDEDMGREAPQSSKIEVYKDAFAHQPRRRTKAWERAPVNAHAPRLQGQKIWKKVGHKAAPQDDKENFESALAELEKAGVGSRKKQRVMGAKENISDAQWQLIQEEEQKNTLALQSPKKNGRLSMAANEDALLVPRKRTNANHLITPRKPLRKISSGSQADMLPSLSKKLVLDLSLTLNLEMEGAEEDDARTKVLEEAPQLHVTNSPEATSSIVIETAEEPERRRKSLRRSTRRVTQNDIREPTQDIQLKPPSISVPSFEVSPAVQALPATAIKPAGDADSSLAQQLDVEDDKGETSNYSMNNVCEVSLASGRLALENNKNSEESDTIGIIELLGDSSDALANQQILEEAFLTRTIEPGPEIDSALSIIQGGMPTTPEPTIDIQPAGLEFIGAIIFNPVATTSTPKFKRKTPQRGSRRSTRTPRTRSSASADLFAQGTEASTINESELVDQATSPLASRGGDLLDPRPEYSTMPQDSVTTPSRFADDKVGSYAVEAYSITEEIPLDGENAMDEEKEPEESSGSLSHEIGAVGEAMDIDISPQSDVQELRSPSLEVGQTEDSVEMVIEPTSTGTKKVDTTLDDESPQTSSLSPQIEQSETGVEMAVGATDAETMDVVASPEAAATGTDIEMVAEDTVQTNQTDDILSMPPDSTVLPTTSPDMSHIVNLFPAAQSSPQDDEPQTPEPEPDDASDESAGELGVFEPIDISVTIDGVEGPSNEGAMDIEESTLPDTDVTESTKDPSGSDARPLVDHEDTDLLRDFMNKVKASKAAKAATGIPERKRSLPHSPLRLPLETESNSSPPPAVADDDEFDVSLPTGSPNKRQKRNDPSLEEDELAEPRSTRRSRRTRLPMKMASTGPSLIPVRRLNQEGDNTVTLRRSEEKELAALTKINTRKNKGAAVYPAQILAKKAEEKEDPASRQRALKGVFDEKAQKKKGNKKGKNVVWAEELAQFQTDGGKSMVLEKDVEVEQPAEEKNKTAVKAGMRSKMSLGMAANGTPASKKKMRAPKGHS
ncbi:hypothetical protein BDZ45DRAFT_727161 [Acephala macrosclerotiorum]|nr:hypothetical protein BDZ45DRAFT_727161 [Acephala macrosclerotiorum]